MKPDSRHKSPAAAPVSDDQPKRIRLQRVLASAGLGSRRHCEEYIVQGRVTIDGVVAKELGTTVDPHRQKIACDGELVRPLTKKYFIFNKPKGVLCTNRDPQGRPRVIDYVGGYQSGLFPVGRLDENSQGLIVVTNDGELAERLAHPRYRVPRTYQVQVAGFPSPETLLQMVKGLYFQEGKFRVQSVARVKTQGESTILDVTLNEGQNREIRRLFARMGHKVLQLERVSFGPLRLGKLAVGDLRPLTTAEVRSLKEFHPERQQKPPAAPVSPEVREARKPRSPAPERDRRRTPPSPAPGGRKTSGASSGRKVAGASSGTSRTVERKSGTGRGSTSASKRKTFKPGPTGGRPPSRKPPRR